MSSDFARSGRRGAESLGAVRAGANTAEMIVAEDAGRVAVGKRDLNGVVANRGRRLRARLRLKHRQRGGGSGSSAGDSALSYPLIIAGGAGTLFAKIREVVVTCVSVRPGDVNTGAAGYVNFYAGRFFAGIDGNGHDWLKVESQQFTVESRAKVWGHCINPTLNIKKPVKRGAGTAVPCPYNCGCSYFGSLPLQQSPGGIGLPCGHVFGCPRKLQMR